MGLKHILFYIGSFICIITFQKALLEQRTCCLWDITAFLINWNFLVNFNITYLNIYVSRNFFNPHTCTCIFKKKRFLNPGTIQPTQAENALFLSFFGELMWLGCTAFFPIIVFLQYGIGALRSASVWEWCTIVFVIYIYVNV